MYYDLMDSAQYLNEQERIAWASGNQEMALLLGFVADRQMEAEDFPEQIDKSFEEGKAEGIKEEKERWADGLNDALNNLTTLVDRKGPVTKADVDAIADQLANLEL